MREDERLLRQAVKLTLVEAGRRTGDPNYGAHSWGDPRGSFSATTYGLSLKSMFVDPFVNALKVTGAELLKIGSHAVAVLRTALESALSVLVPKFQADYDKIQATKEKQIAAIKEKYKSAYDAVDDAWDHPDIQFFSFVRSPATWLTYKAITAKPEAALTVYDAIAEGSNSLMLYLRDIRNRLYGAPFPGANVGMADATSGLPTRRESLVREAPAGKKRQKTPAEQVADALTSPAFLKAVQALPAVKQMQADAAAVESSTSQALEQAMAPVLDASTAEDLSRASGGSWRPPKEYGQLDQGARTEFDQELTSKAHASMAAYFSSRLNELLSQLRQAGVSDKSAYVASLRRTLSELEPIARSGVGGARGQGGDGGAGAR